MTGRHNLCERHTICEFGDLDGRVSDTFRTGECSKEIFGARLALCPLQGKKQKGISLSSSSPLIEMPIVTLLAHAFRLKA